MRPSEDLDTSIFSLDYEYESEPYLPNSMGLKEAKMIDPWTLDFRRKLASRDAIGKHMLKNFASSLHSFGCKCVEKIVVKTATLVGY